MDCYESSLFGTRTNYLLEVHSRLLQQTAILNTEHEIFWHASHLTIIFWKNLYLALLIKLENMQSWITKMVNFVLCLIYIKTDMEDWHLPIKWETNLSRWTFQQNVRTFNANSTFSYLVILIECSFINAAVILKCKNAWLSYTFGFTLSVSVEF